MARCTNGTSKNSNRALTRLIRNQGLSLPIQIDYVRLKVRRRKPRVRDFFCDWPVLSMRSWLDYLFEKHPRLVLAGHNIDEDWPSVFESFWQKWRQHDGDHEVFSSLKPLRYCLPFFTHGDEGHTTRQTPFMVQSFQCAISWMGLDYTTVSGFLGPRGTSSPDFPCLEHIIEPYSQGIASAAASSLRALAVPASAATRRFGS